MHHGPSSLSLVLSLLLNVERVSPETRLGDGSTGVEFVKGSASHSTI